MKEILLMEKKMEQENLFMMIKLIMKENLKMMLNMEKEKHIITMGLFTIKEIFLMV